METDKVLPAALVEEINDELNDLGHLILDLAIPKDRKQEMLLHFNKAKAMLLMPERFL